MSELAAALRGVRRLKLYVAGSSVGVQRALKGRQHLIELASGEIEVEVVDVLSDPAEAARVRILVTPTLADEMCDPPRRLIGDITDAARVLNYFLISGEPIDGAPDLLHQSDFSPIRTRRPAGTKGANTDCSAAVDVPTFSDLGRSGFRLLVENNADGVLVTDMAGTVLYANPAAAHILGKPEQQLANFPLGRPLISSRLVDIAVPSPANGMRDVEMRFVEIVWEGEPALLASLRDVSGSRAEEERRRQSMKLETIGRLTAGVTHDFGNLVAVIRSGLTILRKQLSGKLDRNILAVIEETEGGVARAEDLVRQLLALARNETLSPECVDLNKRIESLTKLLRHTVGTGVEIRTTLDPTVQRILIDATQLDVALLNLAVNARDAMDGRGTLTIETAASSYDEEPSVRLSVVDDGCGMSEEVVSKAFEPFFTTKPDGSGTGLGLSQVHGFVSQSGGHIRIESKAGQGTAIHLLFPKTGCVEMESAVIGLCDTADL